jgi:hypothetical protein
MPEPMKQVEASAIDEKLAVKQINTTDFSTRL